MFYQVSSQFQKGFPAQLIFVVVVVSAQYGWWYPQAVPHLLKAIGTLARCSKDAAKALPQLEVAAAVAIALQSSSPAITSAGVACVSDMTAAGNRRLLQHLQSADTMQHLIRILLVTAGDIDDALQQKADGFGGHKSVLTPTAQALHNMCCTEGLRQLAAELGVIPRLGHMLEDPEGYVLTAGAAVLHALSHSPGLRSPLQEVSVIPKAAAILLHPNSHAAEHAAGIVNNLAQHPDQRPLIEAAGAVPSLIKLLQHSSLGVKEQAAGALQQLCCTDDDASARECCTLISQGALRPLVDLLKRSSPTAEKAAAAILRTVCSTDELKQQVAGEPDCLQQFMHKSSLLAVSLPACLYLPAPAHFADPK